MEIKIFNLTMLKYVADISVSSVSWYILWTALHISLFVSLGAGLQQFLHTFSSGWCICIMCRFSKCHMYTRFMYSATALSIQLGSAFVLTLVVWAVVLLLCVLYHVKIFIIFGSAFCALFTSILLAQLSIDSLVISLVFLSQFTSLCFQSSYHCHFH